MVKPKAPESASHPVDAFVKEKLREAKVSPAQQADFHTLVKRAYLDLHGLPPTPFEIYQFRLAWDKDPDRAWSDLIDHLLDSLHYGERSA
ncbi:MAG: DUF1549 domain-containing protein [Verrucomicrobia bacterium]|nr:DUF1549 domain-containing protein [Verrucomicrobiota bacterium]MDA0724588.1 DUF1549 domain-containing protein [Verrucomicrobiota bacterium]MDA1047014.1 DUF1549 domain-containing protein [Verrucomicrobiota bacterium]